MLCQTLCHHRCKSNFSNGFIPLQLEKIFIKVSQFAKGQDAPLTLSPVFQTSFDHQKGSASDSGERTGHQNLLKDRLERQPDSPRGGESPSDEERQRNGEKGGGEASTLNDWDRAGREQGERGRQRCCRRRNKQKMIDVSQMIWEKITRDEGGSEIGQTCPKGHYMRLIANSACGELKSRTVDSQMDTLLEYCS